MRQVFLIIILLTSNGLYAQIESQKRKKNLVFLEWYGAALEGIGIGYERYFQLNELFRYSLRGGVSYDPDYNYVPLFFGNSFLFGKKHNVEMGLNYMRKYPQISLAFHEDFISKEEDEHHTDTVTKTVGRRDIFNFLIGYRIQNEKSGMMFRMFLSTAIRSETKISIGPHAGMSVGLTF